MKIECSKCDTRIMVHKTSVNQELWKFYQKTGLYLCKECRQELKIYHNASATLEELKKMKNSNGKHKKK